MDDDVVRKKLEEAVQAAMQELLAEENGDHEIEVHCISGDGKSTLDGMPLPKDIAGALADEIGRRRMAKDIMKVIDIVGRTVQATMVIWQVWFPVTGEDAMREWLREFVTTVEMMKSTDDWQTDVNTEEFEPQFLLLSQAYAAAMAVFMESVSEAADKYPRAGRGKE